MRQSREGQITNERIGVAGRRLMGTINFSVTVDCDLSSPERLVEELYRLVKRFGVVGAPYISTDWYTSDVAEDD